LPLCWWRWRRFSCPSFIANLTTWVSISSILSLSNLDSLRGSIYFPVGARKREKNRIKSSVIDYSVHTLRFFFGEKFSGQRVILVPGCLTSRSSGWWLAGCWLVTGGLKDTLGRFLKRRLVRINLPQPHLLIQASTLRSWPSK
jgi:hypothetical protein